MANTSFIAQFCFALAALLTVFVIFSPDDLFLQSHVAPVKIASSTNTVVPLASDAFTATVESVHADVIADSRMEEVPIVESEATNVEEVESTAAVESVQADVIADRMEEVPIVETNVEELESTAAVESVQTDVIADRMEEVPIVVESEATSVEEIKSERELVVKQEVKSEPAATVHESTEPSEHQAHVSTNDFSQPVAATEALDDFVHVSNNLSI
jgi:hypothetical protein